MKFVDGDLTKFTDAEFIAHQCNATGNRSYGLASSLFKTYPYANIYSGKNKIVDRVPGNIYTRSYPGKPTIINMIAQVNPGKPNDKKDDNEDYRAELFGECLERITTEHPNIKTIAIPYGIGCGLAGGNWKLYCNLISNWSGIRHNITVYIVKYNEPK
jgi:hypothetical protein